MALNYTPTTLSDLSNEVTFLSELNLNFSELATLLQDALSRSGSLPNSWEADQDADSFDLNNLGNLTVGVIRAESFYLDGNEVPSLADVAALYELIKGELTSNLLVVDDITEMKALPGLVDGQTIKMATTGRAGDFVVIGNAADYAAELAADPQEIEYVATGNGKVLQREGDTSEINVGWSGAFEDANASSAVAASISYTETRVRVPFGSVVCDDDISGFLGGEFVGDGQIQRGANIFNLANNGATNILYASPGGTGDGLTGTTPGEPSAVIDFIKRQAKHQPDNEWVIQFLSGSYSPASSFRFEDFPPLNRRAILQGEVDGAGVPTVIFDGAGGTPTTFKTLGTNQQLMLKFKNFKWENFTDTCLEMHHNIDIESENLHSDGHTVQPFSYRDGHAKHRGGKISNGYGGVFFAGIYGEIGSSAELDNAGTVEFENLTFIGAEVSRTSSAYVRQCQFTNVDRCVSVNRSSRLRTQDNTFVSWNEAAIDQDSTSVHNDDLSNPDDYQQTGAGTTSIRQRTGGVSSRFNEPGNVNMHRVWNGRPEYAFTDNSGTRVNVAAAEPGLSPFRMPGFWLWSPTAKGELEIDVALDPNTILDIELAGDGSSAGHVLGSINLTESESNRWLVRFQFSGPSAGSIAHCHVVATSLRPGGIVKANSYTFDVDEIAAEGVSESVFRLYATMTGSGAEAVFRRSESRVSF